MMKIDRKHAGFTMAELLITVGIVLALSAVTFVGVNQYQRSMTQLEWDSVAREIFVVAQNHLTMARSQGYLGLEEDRSAAGNAFGIYEGHSDADETSQDGDYFLVVNNGAVEPDGAGTVFEMLLPWGSIEDEERSGNYIIRYNKEAGIVKDVFYSGQTGKYTHNYGTPATYFSDTLKLYSDDKRSARKDYDGSVLGYFGGAQASELLELDIDQPLLTVINDDKLIARVTLTKRNSDNLPENKIDLLIEVKGLTSGKKATFKYNTDIVMGIEPYTYELVLDNVTDSEKHFFKICDGFYPGENLEVQAVCFSSSYLAPVRYSGAHVTNSLFADGSTVTPTGTDKTPAAVDAAISSFRHLENMSPSISKIDTTKAAVYLVSAKQTADLKWADFVTNVGSGFKIHEAVSSTADTYIPVKPELPVTYDGQSHSITGVPIEVTAASTDAGLFGTLASGSEVKNLELVNFDVTGTANAGALAGTVTAPAKADETPDTVVDVLAHNTGDDKALEISGVGSVGGLIGSMTGGTVKDCAAALYVKSTGGSAGGLIGSSNGVAVSDSYSGGHVGSGGQYLDVVTPVAGHVNVIAAASAGGLIGTMTGGTAQYCYSTCSVQGGTAAGGFAGTASGTISYSYCTGLVLRLNPETGVLNYSGAAGAFIGSGGSASDTNNYYFSIVYNDYKMEAIKTLEAAYKAAEDKDKPAIKAQLDALNDSPEELKANKSADTSASPFDATVAAYQTFCQNTRNPALPYSAELTNLYQGRYPYKTIRQLDTANTRVGKQLVTHYGDWPAPELLVYNYKN